MSQDFNYQEALSQCKTMEDITGKDGLVQKIIKDAVEHILGQELEDYIFEKNSSGNKVSRNGSTKKNIKTAYGNIGIHVPRTREPGFEPEVIKKRAVIDEGLEPQVMSMYAKGMTVRDITEHLQALYGIELSATSISNITDKISQEAKDWYCRTLDSWLDKWDSLSTYFCYGYQIRRLIYTTNTIEGFNRQLRKVTNNKAVFPNDESLRKTLYLCTRDITKKWCMPYPNWGETYGQFAIEFGERAKIA